MDEARRSPAAVAGGIIALLALAAGGLYYHRFVATSSEPAAPAAPAAPAVSAPPAVPTLPAPPTALDGSDDRVRDEAASLSSNPLWARWLKQSELIRRLTAALGLIADGHSPSSALTFMAPRGRFRVARRDGELYVDPRSFARYDSFAAAFATIDAQRAASVYRNLHPLFQQACAELDSCDADQTLSRALSVLLAAPVPPEPIALSEKGLVYRYADESLEHLSPAQKQLLRLGPRNEALVQGKLRELATALGLPAK